MQPDNFIRVEPEPAGRAWLAFQQQIRSVLNAEWDPLRVADSVADEYDGYIFGLYTMLRHGDSIEDIAQHLLKLEGQMGGVGFNGIELLREIADKLSRLELSRDIDTR